MAQWLRLGAPKTVGLGATPGQGASSHVPQIKIPHAAVKMTISSTAAKTRSSQINLKKVNWACGVYLLKDERTESRLHCRILDPCGRSACPRLPSPSTGRPHSPG